MEGRPREEGGVGMGDEIGDAWATKCAVAPHTRVTLKSQHHLI
jgi:hypothetical protein